MDRDSGNAIDLAALSKRYGRVPAVDGLTLAIRPGESVGLVGPNGSGKSTTIKMLVGLVRPTSGEGWVFGRSIVRESLEVRRLVGFMPEEVHPYRNMTGREYLAFCLSFHGGRGLDRALDLARKLDLPVDRKTKTYSLGMRVKLGLLQAAAHGPAVLVLDEATKGLDPTSRRQVLDLVREEISRGTTVVLSSHVLSEVERVCTRTEFIRRGRIVSESERSAALERLLRVATVAFEGEVDEGALRSLPAVSGVARLGPGFRLTLAGDARETLRALAALPIRSLELRAPGLEDLYAELYLADRAGESGGDGGAGTRP